MKLAFEGHQYHFEINLDWLIRFARRYRPELMDETATKFPESVDEWDQVAIRTEILDYFQQRNPGMEVGPFHGTS